MSYSSPEPSPTASDIEFIDDASISDHSDADSGFGSEGEIERVPTPPPRRRRPPQRYRHPDEAHVLAMTYGPDYLRRTLPQILWEEAMEQDNNDHDDDDDDEDYAPDNNDEGEDDGSEDDGSEGSEPRMRNHMS